MFCQGCGREIAATDQFCQGCGRSNAQSTSMAAGAGAVAVPAQQPVIVVNQKNPGVAAVLSFFWSGLGQIYNGEIGKGILLLVLYVLSAMLMFAVIGFITTPILWIYGMVDAYKTAEKINAGQYPPR